MLTLAVIMARAGSRELPDKCVLPLCGKPMISYTIGHAQDSRLVSAIALSTDSKPAAAIGRAEGLFVIDRPAHLASDTARVDEVVRHATLCWEESTGEGPVDAVVILYGNIPLRGVDAVDQCIDLLERTGCDCVRTLAPVGKMHPDWMHRLDGDRMVQYRKNSIHRRQELEPLYYHDGGVIAVTRASLFTIDPNDPHAFFGKDRRGVIQRPEDTVDVDNRADFYRAEALIRLHNEEAAEQRARRTAPAVVPSPLVASGEYR